MTIPTALPLKERYILKRHAEAARDLAYVSLNLAQVNEDDFSVTFGEECGYGEHAPAAGPEVVLRWDEATATQMVYLYTEVAQNYSGAAHRFFDTVRRPENAADASLKDTLRLGTLDVGGGTTDLVITQVGAEGVRNSSSVTLAIDPLFSEGFKIAGDDAMLQVVKDHLVPALKGALTGAGLGEERAERVLSQIMGPDHGNRQALDYIRRQQFTALVAAPVGLAMLEEYEEYDPLNPSPGHGSPRRLDEFLAMGDESVRVVIEHFNAVARREGARDFRLQDALVPVNLAAIDRTVRHTFEWMLAAMGELVRAYRCDVLILSGRTSRLPAVRALLEAGAVLPGHRIVSLHQYRVGPWYPFRDERSTVGDPKTTAAVGAMICQLGGNLANFSLRSESLQARSTARHFGKVSPEGRLNKEDTFYDDLDLENLEYQLPENKSFEFRNPMDLGFKQLGVPWWPATKLYHIDYASPADSAKLHPLIPLMVVLKLVPRTEGRSKALVYPDFEIYSVTLRDGRRAPGNLKLKLQTLDDPKGYWLDTGILLEN